MASQVNLSATETAVLGKIVTLATNSISSGTVLTPGQVLAIKGILDYLQILVTLPYADLATVQSIKSKIGAYLGVSDTAMIQTGQKIQMPTAPPSLTDTDVKTTIKQIGAMANKKSTKANKVNVPKAATVKSSSTNSGKSTTFSG